MTLTEAKKIVGNRSTWELQHMKKSLSALDLLNTPEENKRLEAVKTVLKNVRDFEERKGLHLVPHK